MTHVLIVNRDGVLSAMPTLAEFHVNEYITEGMLFGGVTVSPEIAEMVYVNRARVRVLAPDLPLPDENENVFVAVQGGELYWIGSQRPSIKIQKPVGFTSFFKRFFTKKV